MEKLIDKFAIVMALVFALSITSCSSDGGDEPQENESAGSELILGIWEGKDRYGAEDAFLQFHQDNTLTVYDYEVSYNNGGVKEIACFIRKGHYTLDYTNKLLILHVEGDKGDDDRIFKILTLSESRLQYVHIADITHLYKLSIYDKKTDLSICNDYADAHPDSDDDADYRRSSEQDLKNFLDNCHSVHEW